MARRVYRSRRDRMLCGVLGGLAEYFNLDSALVRVIFVLIVLATGGAAGIIAYIVMCIVFPIEGTPESTPHNEAIKQNVEDIKQTAENIAGGFKAGLEGKETDRQGIRGGLVIGMILIFLGCIFMLVNFGMLRWLNWSGAGGILLIILGILLAIGIFRRRS